MSDKKLKEHFASLPTEEKETIKEQFAESLPEQMPPLFKKLITGAMEDILDPEDEDECPEYDEHSFMSFDSD